MPFRPDVLKNAAENPNWDEPPPAGHYRVELAAGDAFSSQRGEDWCKLRWRITAGPHTSHEWDVIFPLEPDSPRLATTAKELKAIGVELSMVGDLAELANAIYARVGRRFRVAVTVNGNFTNTNVEAEDTQMDLGLPAEASAAARHRYEGDIPADTRGLPPEPAPVPSGAGVFDDDDIPF